MAYHEAFWVTVATTAPVIGLTHAVLLGRNLLRVDQFIRMRQRRIDEMTQTLESIGQLTDDIGARTEHARRLLDELESTPGDITDRVIAVKRQQAEERRLLEASLQLLNRDNADTVEMQGQSKAARRVTVVSTIVDGIAGISWVFCMGAFLLGLSSIANGSNTVPVWVGEWAVGIPMILTIVGPCAEIFLRSRFRDFGVDTD